MSDSIRLQLSTTAVLTIFLVIFSGLIAHALHEPRLGSLLQIIALMLPGYGLYALYAAYYNGQRRFGRQALLNFVYAISKLVFVVLGAVMGGLAGAMAGLIIAPFTTMFFGRTVFRAAKKQYAGRIFKLSAPLTGSALVATLHLSVPLLAVQSIVSAHHEVSTGVFAAALNISSVLFFLSTPFTQISLPKVSHYIANRNQDLLKVFINQQLRLLLIALGLVISVILPFSREILTFLYNTSYANGAEVLPLLAVGTGLFAVASLFISMLNGAGNPGRSFRIMSFGLVVLVILSTLLTLQLGQVGAAWAFFASSTLMSVISFVLLARRVGFMPSFASFAKVSLAVVLTTLIARIGIMQQIYFLAGAVIASVTYLLILLAVRALSLKDIGGLLAEFKLKPVGKGLAHE